MPFDLEGKNALVTGASGGIGSEIARALAHAGSKVGLSGTRIEPLTNLAREIGEKAEILPCNLRDVKEVKTLIKTATEKMGSVDILINNAGITRDNLFMRMSDEDWHDVLTVNLNATMQLCRDAIRPMMKARWGRIICVTSIVGSTGNSGQTNYAATKAALTGFSKSLAAEVASRGITVNCIAPGFIETAMTQQINEEQTKKLLTRIPIGRMGKADEIASGAVYLASTEAAYITGTTLHINGGMAMF